MGHFLRYTAWPIVQRWFVVIAAMATVTSVAVALGTSHTNWLWWAVGALALLCVVQFAELHRLRSAETARATAIHRPPGGAVPLVAPVGYQTQAVIQAYVKIQETMDEFDSLVLDSVLANLVRSDIDPVYEPLCAATVQAGVAEMVKSGYLKDLGNRRYRVIRNRDA